MAQVADYIIIHDPIFEVSATNPQLRSKSFNFNMPSNFIAGRNAILMFVMQTDRTDTQCAITVNDQIVFTATIKVNFTSNSYHEILPPNLLKQSIPGHGLINEIKFIAVSHQGFPNGFAKFSDVVILCQVET